MKYAGIIIIFLVFSSVAFAGLTRDWYDISYRMATSSHYLYNKSENLAWGEGYMQNALLDLYEISGDTTLIDEMVKRVDTMMGTMWDVPPENVLCNRSVYQDGFLGWGSTYYDSRGYYQEYILHDGMIIYPMARLIRYIYNDSNLWRVYGQKADYYLNRIESNIIAKWYVNWDGNPMKSGIELEYWGGFRKIPNNHYLVFGAALIILLDLTTNPHYSAQNTDFPSFYLEKATDMGNYFKSNLTLWQHVNAYVWGYWNHYVGGVEDFSHGYVDMLYVFEAYYKGIVFDLTDMQRFTNTFLRLIWNGDINSPVLSGTVDGQSTDNQGYFSWVWPSLCEFDFLVWEVVHAYHERYYENSSVTLRKEGTAHLALTGQRFDSYSPAPPKSVTIANNPNGGFKITWNAPDSDEDGTRLTGLAGYNVFHATSELGPFTRLNDEIIKIQEWTTDVKQDEFYVLTSVDYRRPPNESQYSEIVTSVGKDDLLAGGAQPRNYLLQNYPNPFNASTRISYAVAGGDRNQVRIDVYSVDGKLVKTLVDADVSAGVHTVEWDGTNAQHEVVASGIYLYAIETSSSRQLMKMTFMK